jgi:hypothetical protein
MELAAHWHRCQNLPNKRVTTSLLYREKDDPVKDGLAKDLRPSGRKVGRDLSPLYLSPRQDAADLLAILGLFIKSVPGIIVVRREHMPGLKSTGEVVMAVEVPVATALNEPGATTGTTGHAAGD